MGSFASDEEIVEGAPYRSNFGLGKAGSNYVVYSRKGEKVSVRLPPGQYSATATQLAALPAAVPGQNRRTSSFAIAKDGDDHGFELRVAYDWAIVIRRSR